MRVTAKITCLLALPFAGLAQTKVSEQFISEKVRAVTEVHDQGYDVVKFNLRESSVKGTAMLLPYWVQGDVLLTGNKKSKEAILKYDVYNQQLRVRRPQGDSIAVSLAQVQSFTLAHLTASGQTRVRQFVRCESLASQSQPIAPFAEVIGQGEQTQLLKIWTKSLVKTVEKSGYADSGTPVYGFEDKQQYYLKWLNDNHLTAVRPKRGALKDALANQPAMLRRLADYGSSTTSEAELIAALSIADPPSPSTSH